MEWKEITSIQVHSTGQDWLTAHIVTIYTLKIRRNNLTHNHTKQSHATSFQSLGYDVVTLINIGKDG